MAEPGAPEAPEAQALSLLNALLGSCGQAPLDGVDAEQAAQLVQAHPLLVMLSQHGGGDGASLEERRQTWNKALRRRGWHRLPPLEPAKLDPTAAIRGLRELLHVFGLEVAPADVPASDAIAAAPRIASLAARARALCSPPLVHPARYQREHAAIVADYRELRRTHPGLPPLQ